MELTEDEVDRQETMDVLRHALDTAEPPSFDPRGIQVRLVMTPTTWKVLDEIIHERATRYEQDADVYKAVHAGLRQTKQRIYVTLGINHLILRRLRFILRQTSTQDQEEPFTRMAKQIKAEGLDKNPMEVLADQGL